MGNQIFFAVILCLFVCPTAQSKRAETGSLSVTTSPTGADILIDGIWEGVSPLKLASLRTGVIVVRGEKKGYAPESRKLRIRKDRNSKLTLVLDPQSVPECIV